jgi:uncharacterized heparinase superfamily protein
VQCKHCGVVRYTTLERIVQVVARADCAAGTLVHAALTRDERLEMGEKAIPVRIGAPDAALRNRGSRAVEATAEQANARDVGDKTGADESAAGKPVPATKCGAMSPAPNRWKQSRRSIATRFQ